MRIARAKTFTAVRAACMLVILAFGSQLEAQESKEIKKFPSPFIMTAAGQSPDVLMVKIIAERSKLDFRYKVLAESADLKGMKTMVLVMGVSMKGLGSAGIKLEEEVARVKRLIDQAKKNGMAVVGMFAGGAGGRGGRDQLTDSLISQIAPSMDYLVIIKSGDKDGFFKNIASTYHIPMTYMETIVDMNKTVPEMFK